MVQHESGGVAVLEVGEIFQEHHVERGAVRVQQGESRRVRPGEHSVREGHQRRDAGAGRDPHHVPVVEVGQSGGEGALRAHHVDLEAGVETGLRPRGEETSLVPLHGDAQARVLTVAAVFRGAAQRVGTPDFDAVECRAQRDVLTGQVVVLVGEGGGNREGHLDSVVGERAHVFDREGVEPGALAGCGLAGRRRLRDGRWRGGEERHVSAP